MVVDIQISDNTYQKFKLKLPDFRDFFEANEIFASKYFFVFLIMIWFIILSFENDYAADLMRGLCLKHSHRENKPSNTILYF